MEKPYDMRDVTSGISDEVLAETQVPTVSGGGVRVVIESTLAALHGLVHESESTWDAVPAPIDRQVPQY